MRTAVALVAATLWACKPLPPATEPIFQDGRAVAPAGDSLLAYTVAGIPAVIVRSRAGGRRDTLWRGNLTSPFHVQEHAGHWFVSDVVSGHASIVELTSGGTPVRRIDVDTLATAPHQFAVLPDGRIVLEGGDGLLIALRADTVETFAVFEQGPRTGLLVAALGGVLHAAPGRYVTLYNASGNLRWRLSWPWRDSAFVSDLAVDRQGRTHVLAGEQQPQRFVVFSLSSVTGEVVRWSEPGPSASFAVGRMGEVQTGR